MRIYLANVGANSSHRHIVSPIFEDGKFEFLPIPEDDRNLDGLPQTIHYRDLRSYYNSDQDLLGYVSEHLWDAACHNDPDFEAFTYGDNGTNGRSSALTQLGMGDVLLFLARLERLLDGRRTGQSGFYLVGGLHVEHAGFVAADSPENHRFSNNAHVVRGDGHFLGVAGSCRSRRFGHAVPIVRQICDQVFRDKSGQPWTWEDKSDLARIGSYTRACRCVMDTSSPDQAQRATALREWIAEYSGAADADLLTMG